MARRRINFTKLDPLQREAAIHSLMEVYIAALRTAYPATDGFQLSERFTANNRQPSWSIVRGNWFGLAFFIQREQPDARSLIVRVTAFFPRLERELLIAGEKLHPDTNLVMRHLFAPLLMLFGFLVLPFDLINRSAKLLLRSTVNKAMREVDAIWPQFRASIPSEVSISHPVSPFVRYGLATLLGGVLTTGLFWLANSIPDWSKTFNIAGTVAALITAGLLIGTIMIAIGYGDS